MNRTLTEDEKKEVYDHIREFLSDELDVPLDAIGPDSRIIDELGGDSMLYLELIDEFKRKFGIALEVRTVGLYLQKHPIFTVGEVARTVCDFVEHGDEILKKDA